MSHSSIGEANFQQSEKYRESTVKDEDHAQLLLSVFPYARTAMIIHTVGRVIMFIASAKYPGICKCYFFYEMIVMGLIDQFLPKNENAIMANNLQLNGLVLYFIQFYFEFWSSLIVSLLTLVAS